jgi:hypothetical protein
VDEFFRVHHVYLPASLRNQKAPEMMIELMGRGFAPVTTVFHLLLAKRHGSSRCTNTEISILPKRDDFIWQ